MMELFSPFNPITFNFTNLNWFMIIMMSMMNLPMLWKLSTPPSIITKLMMNKLFNQFKNSCSKINIQSMFIPISLFMMILMMNLMGLLPHMFSPTAQISINMAMAISIWMSIMFKKLTSFKLFISNLIPSGTPTFLIPFMITVEMISLMIQPMTLSIRLTANVMAGHILLTLISLIYKFIKLTILVHSMLTILEVMVSMIQAYVFSMLISMYIN